jgi:hypothetical protein
MTPVIKGVETAMMMKTVTMKDRVDRAKNLMIMRKAAEKTQLTMMTLKIQMEMTAGLLGLEAPKQTKILIRE